MELTEQQVAVLNEVADGVDVASTWTSGGRSAKLNRFAAQLRSLVAAAQGSEPPAIAVSPSATSPVDGRSEKVDTTPQA